MEKVVKSFNELTTIELYEILKLRAEVFVVEQTCAYLDLDGFDKNAYHVYIKDGEEIVAYLRVVDKGTNKGEVFLSRILTKYRKKGLGTKVVKEGIKVAEEKYNAQKIMIGAQKHAVPFYERVGFKCVGKPEYIEDGHPRIYMIKEKGD